MPMAPMHMHMPLTKRLTKKLTMHIKEEIKMIERIYYTIYVRFICEEYILGSFA